MIDLHIHLLPGIDDGPESLDAAAAMCRRAADDGCTDLVATPHQRHDLWWNDDLDRLRTLAHQLQEAVDQRADQETGGDPGSGPRIHLGAEIRVGDGLLEAIDRGAEGGIQPLAGSRYLLTEFSRFVPEPDPVGLVHELAVAGRVPVLAHLEEIRWLVDDLETVGHMVSLGATIQVTGASLTGVYGRPRQERARRLLDAGLVHFLASDAHNLDQRPPGLSAARREVALRWGESVATLLTETNPRAVIEDQPLPSPDETLLESRIP